MTGYVFPIVTTFQIWECHVKCVDKLSENFVSPDTLLNFREVTIYELDTCPGSRVMKIFRCGEPPRGGIGLRNFCSVQSFIREYIFIIFYSLDISYYIHLIHIHRQPFFKNKLPPFYQNTKSNFRLSAWTLN